MGGNDSVFGRSLPSSITLGQHEGAIGDRALGATGLPTQWEMSGAAVFLAAALLLVAAVGGKLIGTRIAGRVLGWQGGEDMLIGWLLQTKALIMIIFANILLDKGVVTGTTFTALLLMAVGSTMLTIPMVTPRLARLRAVISRED